MDKQRLINDIVEILGRKSTTKKEAAKLLELAKPELSQFEMLTLTGLAIRKIRFGKGGG